MALNRSIWTALGTEDAGHSVAHLDIHTASHLNDLEITRMLEIETDELLSFLANEARNDPDQYEIVETRLQYFKTVTQVVDAHFVSNVTELRKLQAWFREESDPIFQKSPLATRARTWPEGYPGDYLTLESIYDIEPEVDWGIGYHIDRYFLASTLAVAVRSRLRKLCMLLNCRAKTERSRANWLNVACGSCREFLSIPPRRDRTIRCVDADQNSLDFAEDRMRQLERRGETVEFVKMNALRLVNADKTIGRFGRFTTVYSVGLFDYLDDQTLIRLIGGLYESLSDDGTLIVSFKDKLRYDTFDYHWLAKWDFFLQRSEPECFSLFDEAGIPTTHLTMVRDDSGVILFFIATK